MIAVAAQPTRTMPDGRREVRVIIVSDTVPLPLPTNGSQVDGLSDDTVFAPFSLLYVVNDAATKVYVANESGVFVAQK